MLVLDRRALSVSHTGQQAKTAPIPPAGQAKSSLQLSRARLELFFAAERAELAGDAAHAARCRELMRDPEIVQ